MDTEYNFHSCDCRRPCGRFINTYSWLHKYLLRLYRPGGNDVDLVTSYFLGPFVICSVFSVFYIHELNVWEIVGILYSQMKHSCCWLSGEYHLWLTLRLTCLPAIYLHCIIRRTQILLQTFIKTNMSFCYIELCNSDCVIQCIPLGLFDFLFTASR